MNFKCIATLQINELKRFLQEQLGKLYMHKFILEKKIKINYKLINIFK